MVGARRSGWRWTAAAVIALCVGLPALASAAQPWTHAFTEKGVMVHTRPGIGGNLPAFRGTTVINARIWDLLAVIDDLDAVCEWAKRCVANNEVRRDSVTRRVFYNRTGAPWPFSDRDAVLLGVVSGLAEGKDVVMRFSPIKLASKPPVSGVVRMPQMKGLYRLQALGPQRTRVIFQITAHPGGWVPNWAARWVSKRIPIDTLDGLRRQVKRTRGRYEKFLDRWDPARRKPPVSPQPEGNIPRRRPEDGA